LIAAGANCESGAMAAARPIVGAVLYYKQYMAKDERRARQIVVVTRCKIIACQTSAASYPTKKARRGPPTLNFPVYKRISAALLEQVDLH
jgi:hypothetical protein